MFENIMRRNTYGLRGEITREQRKLHNTELHALYSSPNIIMNLKSRRVRWERRVWSNPEMHTEFQWVNLGKETFMEAETDLREVDCDATTEQTMHTIGTNGQLM